MNARVVDLSGGRTLVVRQATSDDVDALVALYDELGDEDRYRRFFSMYRPDRAFFERMAAASDRGGLELVATVVDADAEERVVGEAGYVPVQNGNAELAITVNEEWRGWLGPYLLDALLAEASARGVPNLEADVLLANRPMLALARSRGYATKDHTDWAIVHVVIGTGSRTPSWPPLDKDARPRVLVEVPAGRWHRTEAACDAGLQVLACPGPEVNRHCPLLEGKPCPLARDADAIVVAPYAHSDPRWQRVLEGHARLHEGVPICVEVPPGVETPLPEGVVRAQTDAPATAVIALLQRLARHDDTARADT